MLGVCEYKMRALVILLTAVLVAVPARVLADAGPQIHLRVAAGFDGNYRTSPAWVPVRVTATNPGPTTLSGTVSARGAVSSTTYAAPLVLPPATPKTVTLYLPGNDLQGTAAVAYSVGGKTVATGAAYPNPYPALSTVVGALANDEEAVRWLGRASLRHTHLQHVLLNPSTLDPLAGVLATFDAIVISNVDTSQLDTTQTAALEQYVRNGGTLIVVGGPDWQETLSNLPPQLIPGHLTGTRTLSDLAGLRPLTGGSPPAHATTISALDHPEGAVLAQQGGVPLVVRAGVGNGLLEYLAFDPSDSSISHWTRAQKLFTALTFGSMPLSVRHLALPAGDRATSFLAPGPQAYDLSAELGNLPAPGLPVDIFLLASAVLAVLCLALLLRYFTRRRSWISVIGLPLAVVVAGVGVLDATPGLAQHASLVNTVSVVTLAGSGPVYPATRYVGVFAPIAGQYTLAYPAGSLVTPLYPPGAVDPHPPAMTAQEGAQTAVALGKISSWDVRTLTLDTDVTLPGSISADLRVQPDGSLAGTVRNGTPFALRLPILVAGHTVVHLPEIAPGASERVRLLPNDDVMDHDYPEMLFRAYGQPNADLVVGVHPSGTNLGALLGTRAGLPPENSFGERVRNAVNALPETNLLSLEGEVTLVAWTESPLGDFTINGQRPRQRDLTMLVRPITPSLSPGPFRLSSGTFGAQVLEITPRLPAYECCGSTVQPISMGAGGSATFAFSLPHPAAIHLSTLTLHLYAGGIDPSANGYDGLKRGSVFAFDWTAGRWVPLTFYNADAALPSPGRFLSSSGSLMIRIAATRRTGDLSILDPHQDMQITGRGTVG